MQSCKYNAKILKINNKYFFYTNIFFIKCLVHRDTFLIFPKYSDSLFQQYYLYVNPLPPVADFELISLREDGKFCVFDSILVVNKSLNDPDSYSWQFSWAGVPEIWYEKGPLYVYYSEPGSFMVSLYIYNSSGSDFIEKEIIIEPQTGIGSMQINNEGLVTKPAKDNVYIIADKPLESTIIYDITGNRVRFSQHGNHLMFNLPAGLYLVKVNGFNLKLIVK